MKYPLRPKEHELEEAADRYFRRSLPTAWIAERSQHDYGIDIHVDLFEDGKATGLELVVQLKASARRSSEATEAISLRVATYNFLWDRLQVAMLVKYVAEEDEAYWILLRNVPKPAEHQETFTVHLPRDNRLCRLDWSEIQAIVREVTDRKKAAQRAHMLNQGHAAPGTKKR